MFFRIEFPAQAFHKSFPGNVDATDLQDLVRFQQHPSHGRGTDFDFPVYHALRSPEETITTVEFESEQAFLQDLQRMARVEALDVISPHPQQTIQTFGLPSQLVLSRASSQVPHRELPVLQSQNAGGFVAKGNVSPQEVRTHPAPQADSA
jgi:hypothetical protein